jgi:hypothetical protein
MVRGISLQAEMGCGFFGSFVFLPQEGLALSIFFGFLGLFIFWPFFGFPFFFPPL